MIKKLIIVICIVFLVINTKALTLDQSKDISLFARNLLIDGMNGEHVDNKGMPVLAYMQGEARVYGYQNKLTSIDTDYSKKINIGGSKWCFDCASFISYVYKVTINMNLLTSNYLGGNPYMVNGFLNDNRFLKIYTNIDSTKILNNRNNLLPGDLIVIDTVHIAMYIGNDEIAEASSGLIKTYTSPDINYPALKYNLGTGVSTFNNFVSRWKNRKYTVLRLNYDLEPGRKINTVINWPDTKKTVDLLIHNDLVIESVNNYNNETKVIIKMNNNHLIAKYAVSDSDNYDYKIGNNKNSMEITLSENKKYYLSVIDELGNRNYRTVDINNIDTDPPFISKCYYDKEYIYVEASDLLSGLSDMAYSFDNGLTWISDNKYPISDGIFTILVRDKLGNTASTKLMVAVSKENYIPIDNNNNTVVENNNENYNNYNNDNNEWVRIIEIILIVIMVILGICILYRVIKPKNNY